MTYTTAYGNAGSLTHSRRPGSEPTSTWILVRFITAEPHWELQRSGEISSFVGSLSLNLVHLNLRGFGVWSSHCGMGVKDPVCLCGGAHSIPSPVPWVKLSIQRCCVGVGWVAALAWIQSLAWNFHMLQEQLQKEKKKTNQKHLRGLIS